MFTWNVFAIISCLTFALSSREKDFCSSSFICVHGGNRSGTHLTTAALPKRLLHMKFSGTAKVASSNSLKIFDRGSSQLSVKSVCLSAQFTSEIRVAAANEVKTSQNNPSQLNEQLSSSSAILDAVGL